MAALLLTTLIYVSQHYGIINVIIVFFEFMIILYRPIFHAFGRTYWDREEKEQNMQELVHKTILDNPCMIALSAVCINAVHINCYIIMHLCSVIVTNIK